MTKKQNEKQSKVITKSHSKIIDQHNLELPPSWIKKSRNPDFDVFINKSLVFISGVDRYLSQQVISILDSAEEMVVICSFLLADKELEDAINRTAKRGVRVYLMLASEARLDKEPGEDDFSQMVVKQHTAMLKRLGGKVLIRSAPHFHAKVILADPYNSNRKGFLLTANLTKEAIERNEELGVELTSVEIKEAVEYLRWAIWESSDHEIINSYSFDSVKHLDVVDYPDKKNKCILFTSPKSTALKSKLLNVISNAESRIIITSFGWEENHQVVIDLCNKAKQGVKITVLARVRSVAMPALIQLQSAGVEVLGFKWLHVKSIWTDQNEALVMSANIEKHGLDEGFEIGLYLTDIRQKLVLSALNHWINESQNILLSNPTIGNIIGEVKVWKKNKFYDIKISKEKVHNIGDIKVPNKKELEREPNIPKSDWITSPCHQVKYEWKNIAPKPKPSKVNNKKKSK